MPSQSFSHLLCVRHLNMSLVLYLVTNIPDYSLPFFLSLGLVSLSSLKYRQVHFQAAKIWFHVTLWLSRVTLCDTKYYDGMQDYWKVIQKVVQTNPLCGLKVISKTMVNNLSVSPRIFFRGVVNPPKLLVSWSGCVMWCPHRHSAQIFACWRSAHSPFHYDIFTSKVTTSWWSLLQLYNIHILGDETMDRALWNTF